MARCNQVLNKVLLVALISSSFKLLLFRSSFSTDLHVHRNWKAITYNLPLSRWYRDRTSKWTLDYPPLFAFFEYLLAHLMRPFHPPLTDLIAHDTVSSVSVTLLRASVLLTELPLVYSVYHVISTLTSLQIVPKSSALSLAALLLLSPGLTLVDSIHFQYNALPISLLLLTLSHLINRRLHLACFTFCLLINVKHTILPLIPTISMYIIAKLPRRALPALRTLSCLAMTTAATLLLPWLPFYISGGRQYILQIITRLFPFERGLLHANWAPNWWALYAAFDRVLLIAYPKPHSFSTTVGHIGARSPFAYLPNPTPAVCTTLILLSITPILVKLHRNPTPHNLLACCSYNLLAAFTFGWHVHEKSVLLALFPLTLCAASRASYMWPFALLSLSSQMALLELVRRPMESVVMLMHFCAYHTHVLAEGKWDTRRRVALTLYCIGLAGVQGYAGVGGVHTAMFDDKMQFLPILLVSVYCGVGVLAAFGALACDV